MTSVATVIMEHSTDVTLDVLTGVLAVATFTLAAVAYCQMRKAGEDAGLARDAADADRRANAEAARDRFRAEMVLRIAEAIEAPDLDTAAIEQRVHGALAALPVSMLPLTRWQFNVFPLQHGVIAEMFNRTKNDADRRYLLRQEVATTLHELTGTPPQQFQGMMRAADELSELKAALEKYSPHAPMGPGGTLEGDVPRG